MLYIPIKFRQVMHNLPAYLLQETGQVNISPLNWNKIKHDKYTFSIDYMGELLPITVEFENMNLSPGDKHHDLPELYWNDEFAYNVVYHINSKVDQYKKTNATILYTILSTVLNICLDFLNTHKIDILHIKAEERLDLTTGKISNKSQLYKMYAVSQIPNITGYAVDFHNNSILLIRKRTLKESREMNKQYYKKILLKENIKKHIISELLSFDTFLGDLYSQIIVIDPRAEIIEDNNEKVIKIDNIIIQVTTEFDSNKEAKYVIYEYDKKNPNVVKNKFLSTNEVLNFIKNNFEELTPKEIMETTNKIIRWFNPQSRLHGIDQPNFAGNIEVKSWIRPGKSNPTSTGILFKLDIHDKQFLKKNNIELKSNERIYRYQTSTTKAGGLTPFIKININNGLVYFPKNEEDDKLSFDSKGTPAMFINLIKDDMKESKISLYEVYDELRKSGKFSEDYGNYKVSPVNVTWNQITITKLFDDAKVKEVEIELDNDDKSKIILKRNQLNCLDARFIDFSHLFNYIYERIMYADIKNVIVK